MGEKDPELQGENWDRFLPHFRKRNVARKKVTAKKKKSKEVFPPQPTPRKEDLQMETGEYFLNEQERKAKQMHEKFAAQAAKSAEKKRERAKEFEPPAPGKPKRKRAETGEEGGGASSHANGEKAESAKDLAARLRDKAVKAQLPKKRKAAEDLLL